MAALSAWFERFVFAKLDCLNSNITERRKPRPLVITVIGSGGKTTLIEALAKKMAHNNIKTLITTTTKMFPVPAIPNVTQAGVFNSKSGKFESLPLTELERITAGYDLVLVEGDGSRQLPLKGWADYEPVVPAFTTLTVGVIPVWPLGQSASPELIHRPELFYQASGAKPGEPVRPAHLAAIIEKALFNRARGKEALFFSQIENENALASAREVAALLPSAFRSGLAAILAGSAERDEAESLLELSMS